MLCVFSDCNELVFVFCKQNYFFESLLFQTGVSSSVEDLSLLKGSLLAGTPVRTISTPSGATAVSAWPFEAATAA